MDKPGLTPDNIAFMEFVKKEISDDANFRKLINNVLFTPHVVLSQSLSRLRHKLRSKILKGGLEHGSPIYDKKRIQYEIEAECLDLLGWTLVEKWNDSLKTTKE